MIVRLLVANDKANVKKVVLRNDTIVGRSTDCNLRIASNEVSRQHCSILLSELPVRVRDLGSSNGTLLNGKKIKANVDTPLPSGSELEIGNVRFVVQYHVPLDADEPGSTAEVDNSELIAKLKTPVGKPVTPPALKPQKVAETPDEKVAADAPAPAFHRPEVAENPAETIEQETASDADSDTVNEVFDDRSVDVEEETAEAEDDIAEADADATVSFDGSEFPSFDQPEVAAATSTPAEPPKPAKKSGGWKSLFGMFGKSKQEPAPADSSVDQSGEETIAEYADAAQLDDTIHMPPEESGELIDESPQNLDETVPMPFDEEEAGDSGTAIHTDESIVPDVEPAETVQAAETDDENLQDFFQRLSQD